MRRIADHVFCETEIKTGMNIYRIEGERKNALIDVGRVSPEFLSRTDFLILNRCTPDRMEAIKKMIDQNRDLVVLGIPDVLNFTQEFLGRGFNRQAVKQGTEINLGGITLRFAEASYVRRSKHQDRTWRKSYTFLQMPNWQWMDSVYTWIPQQKLLFSGQLFSDEGQGREIYYRKYLRAFREAVAKTLRMVAPAEVQTVLPLWGEACAFTKVFDDYTSWTDSAANDPQKVLIPYASAFGYTELLAEKIAEGIRKNPGIDPELIHVTKDSRPEALERLCSADGIIVGTPTRENDAEQEIRMLFAEASESCCDRKIGAAFGSFSYEPKGPLNLLVRMKQLGMHVIEEPFSVRFRPESGQLKEAERFGMHFGACLLKKEIQPFVKENGFSEKSAVSTYRKFLIVGNCAAGITAAQELRKIDSACRIHIIAEEPYAGYNRQMLTKGMLRPISSRNLQLHLPEWYEKQNIKVSLGIKAERVDFSGKRVFCSDGSKKVYDKLIIATGAEPVVPQVPGMEKQGIYALHTLREIREMYEYIREKPVKDILILGGGILGLEAAAELERAGKNFNITIADRAPYLMAKQLDSQAGELLRKRIERRGIHTELSAELLCVSGGTCIESAGFKDGRSCKAQLMILCSGIRERSQLLQSGGAIRVNEKMETDHPDVYACGDCAAYGGANYGLWPQAVEMGKVAAANAAGIQGVLYKPITPAVTFAGFGVSLFAVGNVGMLSEELCQIKKSFHPQTEDYQKLYFYEDRFVGGILFGHVDSAKELSEAYNQRRSYWKMQI